MVFTSPLSSLTGAESLSRANVVEGASSSPIFLDRLRCAGDEQSLLSCTVVEPLGINQCEHSDDAGVRCEGKG